MDRKIIFTTVRKLLGRGFHIAEIAALDAAIDEAEGVIVVDGVKPKGRQMTKRGYAFIGNFEGDKLESYLDIANVWTIGKGHTGPEVGPGQTITQAESDRLFDQDTDRFEAAVSKLTGGIATDGQFDALVSFAYNLGEGALKTSTLLRLHNEGNYAAAADQFQRWNKAKVNGKLVPVRGLTRRRFAESEMYRTAS